MLSACGSNISVIQGKCSHEKGDKGPHVTYRNYNVTCLIVDRTFRGVEALNYRQLCTHCHIIWVCQIMASHSPILTKYEVQGCGLAICMFGCAFMCSGETSNLILNLMTTAESVTLGHCVAVASHFYPVLV